MVDDAEKFRACCTMREAYGVPVVADATGDCSRHLPPASLVKMLTAMIFDEWRQQDRHATAQIVIAETDLCRGSGANLQSGDILSPEAILADMMLESSNTAAMAAARAVSGNVAAFAEVMNRRAVELGMTASHFTSPHGLDDPAMYSTARDLAVLALAASRVPGIAEVWHRQRAWFQIGGPNARKARFNSTLRIWNVDGYLGGKTGTTRVSGYNLAAVAERRGQRVATVLLGAGSNRDRFCIGRARLDAALSADV